MGWDSGDQTCSPSPPSRPLTPLCPLGSITTSRQPSKPSSGFWWRRELRGDSTRFVGPVKSGLSHKLPIEENKLPRPVARGERCRHRSNPPGALRPSLRVPKGRPQRCRLQGSRVRRSQCGSWGAAAVPGVRPGVPSVSTARLGAGATDRGYTARADRTLPPERWKSAGQAGLGLSSSAAERSRNTVCRQDPKQKRPGRTGEERKAGCGRNPGARHLPWSRGP